MMKSHLLVGCVLLMSGVSACTKALVEDGLPCPCGSGWTCCATQNVCVPESTGCPGSDAGIASTELDAAIPNTEPDATADAATFAGLARFAFVVNGELQAPSSCQDSNWVFWPTSSAGAPICTGDFDCLPADAGGSVSSAALVNVGPVPIAYLVESNWNLPPGHSEYVPGVATGGSAELAGVLDPSATLDITPVFLGGYVALLGSSLPFSTPHPGRYVVDQGSIPWPSTVPGSGGAAQMSIAQIDVNAHCVQPTQLW